MLISTAHAQGAAGGGGDFFVSLLPLLLIFVIFWFFLIRPQQRKAKEHREMVQTLKRGDQVLTAGGIIGRVIRLLDDGIIQVEIADNVRVRVARDTVSQVMSRSAAKAARSAEEKKPVEEKPQEAEDAESEAPAPSGASSGRKSMFSFGSKK